MSIDSEIGEDYYQMDRIIDDELVELNLMDKIHKPVNYNSQVVGMLSEN
jgi:hypothetical protein